MTPGEERRPPPSLDGETTRATATALFAADAIAASAAGRVLALLCAEPGEWTGVAERASQGGVRVRLHAGRVVDVLAEPCELVLWRTAPGCFRLLQAQDSRWYELAGDGPPEPVASLEDGGGGPEQAIALIDLPHDRDPALGALSQLWPMLRPTWIEVGLSSLFVNGGLLLLPLFALLVYDKVIPNGVFETLWALVLGMTIYLVMDAAMRGVRAWTIERVADDLGRRSDERLWLRLRDQTEFAGKGYAGLLAEYRNLTASRDFVSASYLTGLTDLPFFLLYLLAIGIVAWPILILLLVLAVAYGFAGLRLQARANRLARDSESAGTRKLAFLSETLNAIDLVRTLPGAHLLQRRWRSLVSETASLEARRRLVLSHGGTLAAAMSTLTTVAVLTLGAYLVELRMLTVGGLIATSMLATRAMALIASLFTLIAKWEDFGRATASLEASLGLDAGSPAAAAGESGRVAKREFSGRIDVLRVTRRFPGRPTAIDSLGLSIGPGERIALLGRPGSGKTTLIRCLAGLCTPDAGQILIDGVDLADITRDDRCRWLAYKAQDPALFAGTLEENLRIAGVDADHPRLARAIWASGLEDELRSGRMTLGMALAERGANLSGGQRQKVALARVLAQPPGILLLDEPTLGLDPEGERLLAERLPALLEGGVLVVSTHSNVMLGVTGRVVVLDSGRIVADGPKERLLATSRERQAEPR